MLEQGSPAPEQIVSGMWQDPKSGEWWSESRLVSDDEASFARREYRDAAERYETDPDGLAKFEEDLANVAVKHSAELFQVPKGPYPEAGVGGWVESRAEEDATILPEASRRREIDPMISEDDR